MLMPARARLLMLYVIDERAERAMLAFIFVRIQTLHTLRHVIDISRHMSIIYFFFDDAANTLSPLYFRCFFRPLPPPFS